MMDLKDRASAITESAKHRLAERHAEALERENERLKVENTTLRQKSDRDVDRMERLLDSFEDVAAKPKKHRVRRLMTLTVAAGGAYVMGAKAGRERYEQIKRWWDERRNRGVDRMNEWGDDVTSRASSSVQSASQRVADRISDTGTKASQAVEDAGTQRI